MAQSHHSYTFAMWVLKLDFSLPTRKVRRVESCLVTLQISYHGMQQLHVFLQYCNMYMGGGYNELNDISGI